MDGKLSTERMDSTHPALNDALKPPKTSKKPVYSCSTWSRLMSHTRAQKQAGIRNLAEGHPIITIDSTGTTAQHSRNSRQQTPSFSPSPSLFIHARATTHTSRWLFVLLGRRVLPIV